MSTVTPAFAHSLATALGLTLWPDGTIRSGDEVLHHMPLAADGQLRAESYFDFIDWARQSQPDRVALIRRYASTVQLDALGVLGLALKTAPSVRAALQRLERYFRLLTDTAVYRLEEGADGAVFAIERRTLVHPALAFRNECALAGLVHQLKLLVQGTPGLQRVSFCHARPGPQEAYDALFGVPVIFGATQDAIVLHPDTLDRATRLGDQAVSDFFTTQLDQALGQLPNVLSLRSEVLRRLSTSLSSGVPSAAGLAQELGMSERTLFRRLSDEGTTLRDLLREAQIGLSRELLAQSDCSLAEVAFLAGFAEQSTFGRAFKRTTGQTPAQFRATGTTPHRADVETILAGFAQTLAGSVNTDLSTSV